MAVKYSVVTRSLDRSILFVQAFQHKWYVTVLSEIGWLQSINIPTNQICLFFVFFSLVGSDDESQARETSV